jgi:hypothetical protein
MKRIALLILLSSFHFLSAQNFQAGFYGGATMTDIAGTDNNDHDNDFQHLGFTIGGTVRTKVSSTSWLQMELRFIQKGTEQRPIYDSVSGTYNQYFNMTLNYVDAVIGIKHQIHFNIKNKATDRYGIEAGVSVGALVSYSYEVQSVTYTNLGINTLDVSPYVGAYYNITPYFYVEGRYSNSVNSALAQGASRNTYFLYYGAYNDGHNLAFTLTLGFTFKGSSSQPISNPPAAIPATPTDN